MSSPSRRTIGDELLAALPAEGWPGLWGMEGPEYLAWLEEDGGN